MTMHKYTDSTWSAVRRLFHRESRGAHHFEVRIHGCYRPTGVLPTMPRIRAIHVTLARDGARKRSENAKQCLLVLAINLVGPGLLCHYLTPLLENLHWELDLQWMKAVEF